MGRPDDVCRPPLVSPSGCHMSESLRTFVICGCGGSSRTERTTQPHTHKRPYVTYATSRLLPRSTLGPLLSLYTAASALDRGLARIPGGFF